MHQGLSRLSRASRVPSAPKRPEAAPKAPATMSLAVLLREAHPRIWTLHHRSRSRSILAGHKKGDLSRAFSTTSKDSRPTHSMDQLRPGTECRLLRLSQNSQFAMELELWSSKLPRSQARIFDCFEVATIWDVSNTNRTKYRFMQLTAVARLWLS